MRDLLALGPPVYFVLKGGINHSNIEEVNAICSGIGCEPSSLVTYLTRTSKLAKA